MAEAGTELWADGSFLREVRAGWRQAKRITLPAASPAVTLAVGYVANLMR